MRLLNTDSYEVKEFYHDVNIPKYAILSHTWTDEEVTFQDIQKPEIAGEKQTGWRKLKKACAHAQMYDFEWIWIDSCCINKESSAELSEAINSMYRYYLDAEVCYVYLSDVPPQENPRDVASAFRRSVWFERGWTLQELLAPTWVVFLDNSWSKIGTKWSLRDAISAITTIPCAVLEDGDVNKYSIAQRMSWAALRKTTRAEDQAYCLMGLFGVNMPPIYGEGGAKAFMRLQQEIIKISDDRSVFAWIASTGDGEETRGLLARSPYEFRASGDVGLSESDSFGAKSSFTFNNNGWHIHFLLKPVKSDHNIFLGFLDCRSERDDKYLSIYLQKETNGGYLRCFPSQLHLNSSSPAIEYLQEVVVKEKQLAQAQRRLTPIHCLALSPHIISLTERCTEQKQLSWHSSHYCKPNADSKIVHPIKENLVYRIRTVDSEENFSVAINRSVATAYPTFRLITEATTPHILEVMENSPRHFEAFDHQVYSDSMLSPLRNGGAIALNVTITGKDPQLEIGYLAPRDPDIPTSLVVSSNLGFLAPNEIHYDHDLFTLDAVYPPDYFQIKYGEKTYVSVSDQVSFRVLTYKPRAPRHKAVIFVAFGFHENNLWTDTVVLGTSDSIVSEEEIWRSYLDSGSRAASRLQYRESTSVGYSYGRLTIAIKKRRDLQLGTHFLCVENGHTSDES
ncbi:hypothetical protein VKT23_009002 [Stygiomarasmius scandens]|uniref:Heterokaryon incompatibility domain-containing protein n=1 Tax=Marasmiellus scandens TaxID=2682957 RepID=A0ABR1JIY6_9AGAR